MSYPGEDRLIVISTEQLRRIPAGIGIAAGANKVIALHAAANANLFRILVTDEPTTVGMLAVARGEAKPTVVQTGRRVRTRLKNWDGPCTPVLLRRLCGGGARTHLRGVRRRLAFRSASPVACRLGDAGPGAQPGVSGDGVRSGLGAGISGTPAHCLASRSGTWRRDRAMRPPLPS